MRNQGNFESIFAQKTEGEVNPSNETSEQNSAEKVRGRGVNFTWKILLNEIYEEKKNSPKDEGGLNFRKEIPVNKISEKLKILH